MKVLVTGAGGQLGTEVAAAFAQRPHDEVIALSHGALDVTDRDAVLGAVGTHRPDAIVNCAAYTDVDRCESDEVGAYALNAWAVRHLAEAGRRFDAHLCQISTDYVFSGDKATPYHEWDPTSPRSVYGASKLAGEVEAGETATVVRTAWLCGPTGHNIVKTILRLAARDDSPLQFVDDQVGSPTHAGDLATTLRRIVVDRRPGIWHVTNAGSVSWYEVARRVLAAAGHDPERVHAVTTADLQPPRPAPRPANSVLENRALTLAGLEGPGEWGDAFDRLVAQIVG